MNWTSSASQLAESEHMLPCGSTVKTMRRIATCKPTSRLGISRLGTGHLIWAGGGDRVERGRSTKNFGDKKGGLRKFFRDPRKGGL